MFAHLSLPMLLAVFGGAAVAVWLAGVKLSDATDVLSQKLGLGEALGGLILLAIATNLPEIAIVMSGACRGDLGVATGNIFGGIAIQTVVLVVLDIWGVKGKAPLTFRAADLALVLEGVLVVGVLIVGVMAAHLPAKLALGRLAPGSVLIAALWVAGLFLIGRARNGLPWQASGDAPEGQDAPRGHSQAKKAEAHEKKGGGLLKPTLVFAAGAAVTLAAGVALEQSGEAIAQHIGMSGVLFGATVLAAATSLPEVSTGLASVKLGDFKLAISDIFGGNAFLPVLFLPAELIVGKPVLPEAQATDIYLAALGVLLTCVYLYGLVFRPTRKVARMGLDSLVVLILYLVGTAGLFAMARHGA